MTKNRLKQVLHKIHLWLGLTTGLIVVLLSISGALFAFRDELFNLVYKDYLELNSQPKKELDIAQLWRLAQSHASENVEYQHLIKYTDPNKSWCFIGYHNNENSWNYFDNVDYYENLYIDPYTQTVLGKIDMKYDFFELIKSFHYSFFLNHDIGKQITGWSVFGFLFSLITGVYLWFKSKNPFKNKLSVKWNTRWRRVNFDLHNSIGIYASVFGFVFALTGLVISFKWFMSLVYVLVNFSTTPPADLIIHSEEQGFDQQMTQIQKIYTHAVQEYPRATSITFSLPHHDNELNEPCELYIRFSEEVRYDAALAKYDWETGTLQNSMSFDQISNGEKILYMNYDIHVGSILGVWGKLLAFFGSLMCSSLPITGFIIWLGRRNKLTEKPRAKVACSKYQPVIPSKRND